MMSKASNTQALAILDKTCEGKDLALSDYILVMKAVDTEPTMNDLIALEEIYKRVSDGTYAPFERPWFWGIEHLSKDNKYVCWKGQPVGFCADMTPLEERSWARSIADRCLRLESLEVWVTVASVSWYWKWFDGIDASNPFLSLLGRIPLIWERRSALGLKELMFVTGLEEALKGVIWDGEHVIKTPLPTADHAWFRSMGWEFVLHDRYRLRAREMMGWRELCGYLESLGTPPDILDR